jgi:hypothetical protein
MTPPLMKRKTIMTAVAVAVKYSQARKPKLAICRTHLDSKKFRKITMAMRK